MGVGSSMPLKELQYKGMTLKAGAFEVIGTGRFLVSVGIARGNNMSEQSKVRFFEPPSANGLFSDPEAGLASALAFGRDIIDGNVAGLTVDDL